MDYDYDVLNRLTAATYSDGQYDQYTYDSAGNRMSETTPGGTQTYTYDAANRLTSVDGVSYTWDNNGNLTGDGVYTYGYDQANRLTALTQIQDLGTTTFAYNGLGDRLKENDTTFVLDLAASLTQALQDETHTYLYGNDRIAQQSASSTTYFLGDALGSVRQLVDERGALTLTQSYEPYGQVLNSTGSGSSDYGFAGEWTSQRLIDLRARFYSPYLNQFIQTDTIVPNPYQPQLWNRYSYAGGNPINYVDPEGTNPYYYSPLARFTDERTDPKVNLWGYADMNQIEADLWDVASAYAQAYNEEEERIRQYLLHACAQPQMPFAPIMLTPEEAFYKIHKGPLTIVRIGEADGAYGQSASDNRIEIFTSTTPEQISSHPRFIVHEVGHSFENAMVDTTGRIPGWNNGAPIINSHKWGREGLSKELYDNRGDNVTDYGGFHNAFMKWQFSRDKGVNYQANPSYDGRGEIFADMFVGWVYNQWEQQEASTALTELGKKRKDYMDSQMSGWIYGIIQVRTGKIAVPYVVDGKIVYRYQHY